jgi:hypothetical protein
VSRTYQAACTILVKEHRELAALEQENTKVVNSRGDLPADLAQDYERKRKSYEGLHRAVVSIAGEEQEDAHTHTHTHTNTNTHLFLTRPMQSPWISRCPRWPKTHSPASEREGRLRARGPARLAGLAWKVPPRVSAFRGGGQVEVRVPLSVSALRGGKGRGELSEQKVPPFSTPLVPFLASRMHSTPSVFSSLSTPPFS